MLEERDQDEELKRSLISYPTPAGELHQWVTVENGVRTTSEWLNRAPLRMTIESKNGNFEIFHAPKITEVKDNPTSQKHLSIRHFQKVLCRQRAQDKIANQLYEIGPEGKRQIKERYIDTWESPRYPLP